jgi:hypothetical protein
MPQRAPTYLPEGAVKDDLMRRSRDILARAEGATKEQERLERDKGQIEGGRFVEPEPRNVGALFTNERKGTESDAIKYCLWASPAYYQHEAGELEISPEDAQKYADAYKVSAHWILTGAHQ